MERESIAGSACKRLAMVEDEAGSHAAALAAVRRMQGHYARAEQMARAADAPDAYYPALNRIAAELVSEAGASGWRGLDSASLAGVRQRLADKTRDDPDFWSVAGLTELRLYEAVAARALAAAQDAVTQEYEELHRRVSGTNYWRSLYDTARFVLDPYAERSGVAEKKAAAAVVALLEGYAWPS
jgi:hypothetical protein